MIRDVLERGTPKWSRVWRREKMVEIKGCQGNERIIKNMQHAERQREMDEKPENIDGTDRQNKKEGMPRKKKGRAQRAKASIVQIIKPFPKIFSIMFTHFGMSRPFILQSLPCGNVLCFFLGPISPACVHVHLPNQRTNSSWSPLCLRSPLLKFSKTIDGHLSPPSLLCSGKCIRR